MDYNTYAVEFGKKYRAAIPQAQAIAEKLREDGQEVDDSGVEDIAYQLARTGDFNFTPNKQPQSLDTTEEQAKPVSSSPVMPKRKEEGVSDSGIPLPDMTGTEARAYEPSFTDNMRSLPQAASDFGAWLRSAANRSLATTLEAPFNVINAVGQTYKDYGDYFLPLKAAAKLIGEGQVQQPEWLQEEAERLRGVSRDIAAVDTTREGKIAKEDLASQEGFAGTLGYLATHPASATDFAGEQIGQLLPSIVGGPEAMLTMQALQAGGSAREQVLETLRQKGITGEEANAIANRAFRDSTALNSILPRVMHGGRALEDLISKGTTGYAGKSALGVAAGSAAEEATTEGLDQMIQNIYGDDPAMRGVGQAVALGLAAGAATGGAGAVSVARENAAMRRERTGQTIRNTLHNSDIANVLYGDPNYDPNAINLEGVDQVGAEPEVVQESPVEEGVTQEPKAEEQPQPESLPLEAPTEQAPIDDSPVGEQPVVEEPTQEQALPLDEETSPVEPEQEEAAQPIPEVEAQPEETPAPVVEEPIKPVPKRKQRKKKEKVAPPVEGPVTVEPESVPVEEPEVVVPPVEEAAAPVEEAAPVPLAPTFAPTLGPQVSPEAAPMAKPNGDLTSNRLNPVRTGTMTDTLLERMHDKLDQKIEDGTATDDDIHNFDEVRKELLRRGGEVEETSAPIFMPEDNNTQEEMEEEVSAPAPVASPKKKRTPKKKKEEIVEEPVVEEAPAEAEPEASPEEIEGEPTTEAAKAAKLSGAKVNYHEGDTNSPANRGEFSRTVGKTTYTYGFNASGTYYVRIDKPRGKPVFRGGEYDPNNYYSEVVRVMDEVEGNKAPTMQRTKGHSANTVDPNENVDVQEEAVDNQEATEEAVPEVDEEGEVDDDHVDADADTNLRTRWKQEAGVEEENLAEAADTATQQAFPANHRKTFRKRTMRMIKKLVAKDSSTTRAIEGMLNNGRILVVDNPARLGMEPTARGAIRTDDGRIFVFMDNIKDDDVVGALTSITAHEGVHAGSMSPRAARTAALKTLMGDTTSRAAADKIRAAAKAGNKLAQEAVARAEATSDESVQHLEIPAYFAEVVAENRSTALGRVRGAAVDILTGARNAMRKAGIPLAIDMNDVASAVKDIQQEVANSEMKGTDDVDADQLYTIGGKKGKGFATAAYKYRGRVDGKERYEIDDSQSKIGKKGLKDLDTSDTTTLGNLYDSVVLTEHYPQLADMEVRIGKKMESYQLGMYVPKTGNEPAYMVINNNLVEAARDGDPTKLLNTIAHETQHAVQLEEGHVRGWNPEAVAIPFKRTSNERIAVAIKASQHVTDLRNAFTDPSKKGLQDVINDILDGKAGTANASMAIRHHIAALTLRASKNKIDNPTILKQLSEVEPYYKQMDAANKALNSAIMGDTLAVYRSDYGETEARNTEARLRMTPEERLENPPEDTMRIGAGVDVSDTIDASRRPDDPARMDKAYAAMADKYQYNDTKAHTSGEPVSSYSINPLVHADIIKTADGENLFRILRHQTNERTADIAAAEFAYTGAERAVEKRAKELGVDVEDVKKDVSRLWKNLDKAKDQAEANTAWANFKNAHPGLEPMYRDFRNRIDHVTNEIIQTRMNDPRPLTASEVKLYQHMMDNRGKYMHRAYAAYQGKAGKKFGNQRMDNYAKAMDILAEEAGKTASGTLTQKERNNVIANMKPQMREDYKSTAAVMRYISKRLSIPARADLELMSMRDLEKLYNTWVDTTDHLVYNKQDPNPSAAKKQAFVDELERVGATLTPEMVNKEATEAARTLLGLDENNTVGMTRELSQLAKDSGALKKRKAVPPVVRNFLGEIKDPNTRVMATMVAQSSYLARARALADLKTKGLGTLVIPLEDKNKPGNEKFTQVLVGDKFGALKGYVTTPEISHKLSVLGGVEESMKQAWALLDHDPDVLTKKVAMGAIKTLRKISGIQKFTTVIMNPYKHARNFAGSPLMTIRAGNFNLFDWGKGAAGGLDYMRNQLHSTVTSRFDDYSRYLGMESAHVGELHQILGSVFEDVILGKTGAQAKATKLLQKAKKSGRVVTGIYAMSDGWAKIANFENRVRVLSAYNDAMGSPLTMEQVKQQAGDEVNYTDISFDRASMWAKAAEKIGLTQYAPYFSEVIRTTLTGYIQATTDIRTAIDAYEAGNTKAGNIMMQAGMSRYVGLTAVTFGVPYALASAGLALSDGDDDNKRRLMLSDINRHTDLMYAGQDEDGRPTFLPIGSVDPVGPVSDPMRAWIHTAGSEGDKAKAALKQIMDLYVSPSWISRVVDAYTRVTVPDPAVSRMVPDLYGKFNAALNAIGGQDLASAGARTVFAAETFMPDWLKSMDPRAQAPQDGPEWAKFLSATGARFEHLNPERTLTTAQIEQKDVRTQALNNINVLLSKSENLTENELVGALSSFRTKEMDRLEKIYKLQESLELLGLNKAQANKMLKEAGFSDSDLTELNHANPRAQLSMQSIRSFTEKKTKGMSKEERERFMRNMNNNVRTLRANRQWLQSMGIVLGE